MPRLTIQHVPESDPPQFRLHRERDDDGPWIVVVEKKAASTDLHRAVVQQLLGYGSE